MKRAVLALGFLLLGVTRLLASGDAASAVWVTDVHGAMDSGWGVSFPAGPSDFFSVGHDVIAGSGNSEELVDGLPVNGLAVSIADFGTTATFPRVGVYNPNLGLDASGNTPDLGAPITEVLSPARAVSPFFNYVHFELPEGAISGGSTKAVAAVQFPPGDTSLSVGADSNSSGVGNSGFTTDGYASASITVSFLDWGINVGQDNSSTTSCKQADRIPNGRLRVSGGNNPGSGDHLTLTVASGDPLNISFFGNAPGDKLLLYLMTPGTCIPITPIGPVLNTQYDDNGGGPDDGSFQRVQTNWPVCSGAGITATFSAVWGNAACGDFSAGAGFTNCITIITIPDPPVTYPFVDDGTIESAWIVQFPSGPSDYFNNELGAPPAATCNITGLTVAVMDFVTAVPEYPTAGVSNANLVLDPGGGTPDISGAGLLAVIAPFTFASGTVASTSATYTTQPVSVPAASLSTDVHGWVQFPKGDPGLLGVGADSSSASAGASFFSLDGYTTPSTPFLVNWGIRLQAN